MGATNKNSNFDLRVQWVNCLSLNSDRHQLSPNTVYNKKLKKLCSIYQRAIFLRAQPCTPFLTIVLDQIP